MDINKQCNITVRKYKKEDRLLIRKIYYDTAFLGESAEQFFYGRDVLSDLFTVYYTDYEPESLFVSEINGEVVGYLTGCKDIKKQKKIFMKKILPSVVIKFLLSRSILSSKNFLFLSNCLLSLFKKELITTDVSKDYPATLHINISSEYRGIGTGRKLIEAYLSYLQDEKIKGVYLTTISYNAVKFFERQGFNILSKKIITCFSYIYPERLYRFVLGKKLTD
ncbi:MAG: GNAT family N-acetyltransferase [bacterium]|nr:GNAT family N-acetyltransferase [bacterium]